MHGTIQKLTIIPGLTRFHCRPSYVAWDSATGERLIGDAAKNQATTNPTNTVFDIKRLIGRRFDERSVQADSKLFPFNVVNKDAQAAVEVRGS